MTFLLSGISIEEARKDAVSPLRILSHSRRGKVIEMNVEGSW